LKSVADGLTSFAVTISITNKGVVVIPQEVRKRKNIRPGDDLEVLEDEDDPSVIILRKVRLTPNAGLVAHLVSCPAKGGLKAPRHRRESLRKARL